MSHRGSTPLTVLPQRDDLGVGPGRLLVDGDWVDAADGKTWTHVHPATGEEVTTIAVAGPSDVDRAVGAARRAFDEDGWPRLPARDRGRLLRRIAETIDAHRDELVRLQTLDNGMPVAFSNFYQVSADVLVDLFDHYAGWVDKAAGDTLPHYTGPETFLATLREPAGVVASVIPWNAPLILLGLKIAPALAAGCTVVLKPSEYASLCALRLGELLLEAGVPPGVVNIVTGPGPTTGEALITDPRVDKLAFTGSRAVGEHVMKTAAHGPTRVSLELGGKSANIVFPDADLGIAAAVAMGQVSMGLSGQGCACLTRCLAHIDVYDDLVAKAAEFAGTIVHGDPFDPGTGGGPLINERQLERVLGYVEQGVANGGELVCGGSREDGELASGYWVEPTLIAGVDHGSAVAQEEIFGPVLVVVPFRDEEEAITLANDSSYGLGGAVYTNDVRRGLRVAKAVRTGTFGVNTYRVLPHAPFGGYKASGIGREGGRPGLDAYTELKTVLFNLSDGPLV